ncbi:unnamed protein product, partial [Phaeothamnion confervicola]
MVTEGKDSTSSDGGRSSCGSQSSAERKGATSTSPRRSRSSRSRARSTNACQKPSDVGVWGEAQPKHGLRKSASRPDVKHSRRVSFSSGGGSGGCGNHGGVPGPQSHSRSCFGERSSSQAPGAKSAIAQPPPPADAAAVQRKGRRRAFQLLRAAVLKRQQQVISIFD